MADPMSDEHLAEIREREQKVPAAPWRVEDDERTLKRWILSENGELEIGLGYLGNRTEDVAAFIVHAREDIPALLREVERLRPLEMHQVGRWLAEATANLEGYITERADARAEAALARARAEATEELKTVQTEARYQKDVVEELRRQLEHALRREEELRQRATTAEAKLDEALRELAEERRTANALLDERKKLREEGQAAREKLAFVRSFAERIDRSADVSYANAGQVLLDIVGPVTVAPGTPAAAQICAHRDFDDPTRCLLCHP